MTLIAITAPASGPVAIRQGDLVIPGTEVAFGGFSSLMGLKSTDGGVDRDDGDRDIYLIGITDAGLQLARAGINDLNDFAKYTFWNPQGQNFTTNSPLPTINDTARTYLPGSFSSGSIFYSPYFATFIMVNFNKMVDSTFYIRYLELNEPLRKDNTWVSGGKNGKGISSEDVEALVKYHWSSEQKLYASPPGKGGFNYAGIAHPEYFNTQYFAPSLYPSGTKPSNQRNDWYGSSLISKKDGGGDGRNLLLSWTSQVVGGTDNGIYQIQLAILTFDNIPQKPAAGSSPSAATSAGLMRPSPTKVNGGHPSVHVPVSSVLAAVGKGSGARNLELALFSHWWVFFMLIPLYYLVQMRRPAI